VYVQKVQGRIFKVLLYLNFVCIDVMRKVFLFNPTNEIAVANDTSSYTPPEFLRKFERDVAPLMGFVGSDSDLIISNNCNSQFLEFWERAGVRLPKFTSLKDIPEQIGDEKLFFMPWGWSKTVHRLLGPLKQLSDPSFVSSPVYEWKKDNRDVFSRETSVKFLNEIKERTPDHDFISIPYYPVIVESMEELLSWEKRNELPYVFKTPWSSSGRGLYPVNAEDFVKRSRIWVKSRLRQQGKLIIEPWLNKKQDLSFQFYIHSGGEIDYLGLNYFEAGDVGEFKREFIGMPEVLFNNIEKFNLPEGWEDETVKVLLDILNENGFHKNYCGPIGIDGMIFEDESGGIKVHPCIEINFRMNMGYVNLKLKDILHFDSVGEWTIRQFKPGEWERFAVERMNRHPVDLAEGKICKGFLPLVPVTSGQHYGVWAEIKM